MKLIITLGITAVIGMGLACSRVLSISSSTSASDIAQSSATTVYVSSKITDSLPKQWQCDGETVKGKEAMEVAFFVNKDVGWIGGEKSLYKTDNGGIDWVPGNIDVPEGANVFDIFFVNNSVGWVVLQKKASDFRHYHEHQFWLMETVDGGRTWRIQKEEQDTIVTHVSFVNEREGWLTGVKYIGIRPLRFILSISHTSDQGQNWIDVSGDLNRLSAKESGDVDAWVTGIVPEGPGIATVLTQGLAGKLFRTTNGGKSWQPRGDIPDEPAQTGIRHMGIKNDRRIWLGGGAFSMEGIWGMVAIERPDRTWTRYGLGGTSFADVLFVSERQVLACGSMSADKYDQTKKDGVILYSSDEGHTWSIIYRNPNAKTITKLFAIDSKHVWAVGEGGLVVRLESTQ